MSVAAPEPLWDVVEEHLDEAEFLWEQWEHALVAPNYNLDELAEGPEARLLAHLDGLVVGGPPVARRLLIPTLDEEDAEPTRVRAAALALLHSPGAAGLDAVLDALQAIPALRPEFARALECSEHPGLLARVRPLLGDPQLRATAARVLTSHHQPLGPLTRTLLASDDPREQALALENLAFEPGAAKHAAAVLAGLSAADPGVRDAALTAGVLLALPPAWARARELAGAGAPDCAHALLLLGLRAGPGDAAAIVADLARPELRAAALYALGFVGTAEAVEASLPWLEDASHGRLAGEVLCAVTGLDLEDADLARPDDEADEPLEHHPEHDLARPEPISTLLWWTHNAARFAPGQRWLRGAAYDRARLLAELHAGPMRRRPALALDLLLQTGTHNRLALRAPTARQRAELARLSLA